MIDYRLELSKVLSILAQPWQEQVRYLECHRVDADELALEFDDLFCVADAKREAGELSEKEHKALHRLDHMLDRMSGSENAHLWTNEALKNRPEWEDVRRLARDVLIEMHAQ